VNRISTTLLPGVDFQVTDVFWANYQATEDVVVNQGGTDSGKTYAIMQLFYLIGLTHKAPTEDPIITIVAESVPNLKAGAYRIAKAIRDKYSYIAANTVLNETDRKITFKTGWVMEFNSYEDEQQAKQGKRQYCFFNEAQGVEYMVFWQVAKRTRIRSFIDYNPTAPFWSHDKLIGTNPDTNDLSATVKLIISDHRHNTFLSAKDHDKTERIKDKELWKVYARGKTGNLEGIIFPNWKQIPDADYPTGVKIYGGLDFGYTNDPTAGVKICQVGGALFIHELCYEPGITAVNLKQLYVAHGFNSGTPLYCEHDPDNIAQLRRLGMNALPAHKGQGSIKAGILKLKEFDVFYTDSSRNIYEERRRYMWEKNPDTGKPTNEPIDDFNHLMDAIRYGVYTHFYK
jgi:phage terminase large subunit